MLLKTHEYFGITGQKMKLRRSLFAHVLQSLLTEQLPSGFMTTVGL